MENLSGSLPFCVVCSTKKAIKYVRSAIEDLDIATVLRGNLTKKGRKTAMLY